ncbi:MAG: 30S ribosomal protein S20 [Lachnospiraceae bacterium]|nr:30S ribosomal protein S20 [Lachnospiraceae bacterium]
MANIKSAEKRVLVAERNAARNKAIKSKVKTAVKKVDAAIASGDKAAAQECLVKATKELDMATSKGVFHKNTSSRKVSRLAKAVNNMEA